MRAILLSAGRGSRLLPLTADLPKCLLPIMSNTVLGLQLDTLLECGIDEITVVTGFNEDLVNAEISRHQAQNRIHAFYNPFFQVADNLASCWMAREFMQDDFLVINGDTLFAPELLEAVLRAPAKNISVTIDQKEQYDGDDMKVTLDGEHLRAIGKTLLAHQTHGESIGMLRFMQDGPKIFTDELERMMRLPDGTTNWYLSAIDQLAKSGQQIDTLNIKGTTWAELDTPDDYEHCLKLFANSALAQRMPS